MVNNGFQNLYTRDGAFGVDENNFLVDPATGFHVQRFGSVGEGSATSPAFQTAGGTSIKIPFGTGVPGKATSNITLQGNLSAGATGPLAQTLTSVQAFKAGGVAATTSTALNSLDDNAAQYVNGDSIVIAGVRADGTSVPANTTLAVTPTTTLGDLITAINSAFPGSTASLDTGGNLVLKCAGEWGGQGPPEFKAVTAVCPAMDLAASADALHEPANRLYEWYFLLQLHRRLRAKAKLFPNDFDVRRLRGVTSLRLFDDRVTAYYCGFAGADDYYARAAATNVVDRIAVPGLILHAANDPFIRVRSETLRKIAGNPNLTYVETADGGHWKSSST